MSLLADHRFSRFRAASMSISSHLFMNFGLVLASLNFVWPDSRVVAQGHWATANNETSL